LTELVFFILFGIVLGLWIRASIKASKLFEKAHEVKGNFSKQIEKQLAHYDQIFGMVFGNPENYPLYRPELLPYVKSVRAAFQQAWFSIALFAIYLIISNAL
jgi:hypothetical protein